MNESLYNLKIEARKIIGECSKAEASLKPLDYYILYMRYLKWSLELHHFLSTNPDYSLDLESMEKIKSAHRILHDPLEEEKWHLRDNTSTMIGELAEEQIFFIKFAVDTILDQLNNPLLKKIYIDSDGFVVLYGRKLVRFLKPETYGNILLQCIMVLSERYNVIPWRILLEEFNKKLNLKGEDRKEKSHVSDYLKEFRRAGLVNKSDASDMIVTARAKGIYLNLM